MLRRIVSEIATVNAIERTMYATQLFGNIEREQACRCWKGAYPVESNDEIVEESHISHSHVCYELQQQQQQQYWNIGYRLAWPLNYTTTVQRLQILGTADPPLDILTHPIHCM